MEYKQRVEEAAKKRFKNYPDMSGDELLSWDIPRPKHGDTWGSWKYDAVRKVLILERKSRNWYEVDLELCKTKTEIISWLLQLKDKTWITSTNLGNLIMALDDVLKLRKLKQ